MRCSTSKTNKLAELINYGQFLEQSSGRSFCGDRRRQLVELRPRRRALAIQLRLQFRRPSPAGTRSGAPLCGLAFDWLRDQLAPLYEKQAARAAEGSLGRARRLHPRDSGPLGRVRRRILLRSTPLRPLDEGEQVTALKLLEIQRHAMLMYTSCGWFFDELSGLETVQVIHYAGRALELAEECVGRND